MRKPLVAAFAVLAAAAVSACSGLSNSPASNSPMLPIGPQAAYRNGNLSLAGLQVLEAPRHRACQPVPEVGHFSCFAIVSRPSIDPRTAAACAHQPGCYLASDLEAAYGVTEAAKTAGKGVVVAVIDAYGYPEARKDLATYRKLAGLPPANRLEIVNEAGRPSPLPTPLHGIVGWQVEEALDVDMVSAMCPNCSILLVQASNDTIAALFKSEQTALRMASITSNSWGGAEQWSTQPIFDSHPYKVIVGGAGDGAGVPTNSSWGPSQEFQPCGFQGVVCAGGTSLVMNGSQRVSEVVWQDFAVKIQGKYEYYGATGSGCSAIVPKPRWQTDKGCTARSASDISANADPLTGVIIICTPCAKQYGGTSPIFAGVGGTSESTPIIAGMYGLAGNVGSIENPVAQLWSKGGTGVYNDITSGYNDLPGFTGLVCWKSIDYICNARKGYDGPSGWGTPNGLGAL